MTFARFLLGLPLAVVLLAGPVLGARTFRRALLPTSGGVDAALTDTVVVLTIVTVAAQALGSLGWFAMAPLVAGCAALGGLLHLAASMRGSTRPDGRSGDARPGLRADVPSDRRSDTPLGRGTVVAAGAAVLLVVGSWIARTVSALDRGMTTADTLWYHLPYAVHFVQTGRMTDTIPLDTDSVTAYFPATSSIYHAVLYLLFDSDLVSVVVNLGWLGLALAAAWSVGRRFGAGIPAVLSVALVMGTPVLIDTQPGGALTDVVGLALLLVATALALNAEPDEDRIWRWVPVGLALGLSTGMKFTFIAPAALVALAVSAVAPRGARSRRFGTLVAAALLSGGYWYLRNLILVGNPLPALDLQLGPVHLRGIPGSLPQSSVADLVLDGDAWATHLVPGFRDALGIAWPLVLLVSLGGALLAAGRGGSSTIRALGGVSIAAFAVFIWNPQYLFGGLFFATNLRYGLPSLVLGALLATVVLARYRSAVALVLVTLVVVTQASPAAWGFGPGTAGFFEEPGRRAVYWAAAAVVGLGVAAVLAWMLWQSWSVDQRRARSILSGGACILVLAMAATNSVYVRDRYVGAEPFPNAYEVVRDLSGARIGVHGQLMMLKYGFAGADWSNVVRYVVVEEEDGGIRPARSCAEWVGELRAGRYDHLVLNVPMGGSDFSRWTSQMRGAELIDQTPLRGLAVNDVPLAAHEVLVFRLPADLSDDHC